jgi:hypothetical protein
MSDIFTQLTLILHRVRCTNSERLFLSFFLLILLPTRFMPLDLFFRARFQLLGTVPRPILISPSCSKASLVSRNVHKVYRTVTDVLNDLSPKSSVQTVPVFTLSMVRGSAHKVRVLYSQCNPWHWASHMCVWDKCELIKIQEHHFAWKVASSPNHNVSREGQATSRSPLIQSAMRWGQCVSPIMVAGSKHVEIWYLAL